VTLALGLAVSAAALWLAFRQVDAGRLGQALTSADPWWVLAAATGHLVAVGAMAARWRLLFPVRPQLAPLARALFVAHLANAVLPIRFAGMVARAYLVGRLPQQSAAGVLATIVVEKLLETLALLLLAAWLVPWLAPQWSTWPSLLGGAVVLLAGGPLLLAAARRHQAATAFVQRLGRQHPRWLPPRLQEPLAAGLAGLARAGKIRPLAAVWGWTWANTALGLAVNAALMAALHLPVSLPAAALLLVALQVGNRLVPIAPLGGVGVFQLICTETLAVFGIHREIGLSYGVLLQGALLLPGALWGAWALYREHGGLASWRGWLPPTAPGLAARPRDAAAADGGVGPGTGDHGGVPPAVHAAVSGAARRVQAAALPSASVVVVHHGTPGLLRQCLDRLQRSPSTQVREIWVVDNPGGGPGGDALQPDYPHVRWWVNARNVGFAAACNQALSRATGEACLILNPDTFIDGPAIDQLLATLARHADVGAVAPRLVYPDGRLQLSCRRVPTLAVVLLRGLRLEALGRSQLDWYLMRDFDHASARQVDWALGGCLLLRRAAVDPLGGFDEGFFLYYEDTDLCLRLAAAGWRVLYEPSGEAVHCHRRQSAAWPPGRTTWIHLRSLLRLHRKHRLRWGRGGDCQAP
jgi:GT2 family glycosyltransferase/uncharacterized membrane protein YbhN (UPF0104 family)